MDFRGFLVSPPYANYKPKNHRIFKEYSCDIQPHVVGSDCIGKSMTDQESLHVSLCIEHHM